jgi:hypothetical protein
MSARRGQAMTEYVILVGLLVFGSIAAVAAYRRTLRRAFEDSTTRLSNELQAGMAKERLGRPDGPGPGSGETGPVTTGS